MLCMIEKRMLAKFSEDVAQEPDWYLAPRILASEDELVVPDVDIRPLTAIFSQQFVDSLVIERLHPYIFFLGTLAGENRGQ